ncbi:MAG TPA: sigma-70 family RNA polymerase sigma factor [Candidatus Kapabacteria bacterium]|nr:sigma-70 family RNA polymerase sigma factor [Candidatus Kapabacteria bacterium]
MRKSDQELLAAIAEKDSAAIAELYDRYSRIVYGALLRLLRDTDDAEDTLQEVFIQVWRKASTYQPSLGAPKQWMIRIAHNRAINLIRSKRSKMKQSEVSISEDGTIASGSMEIAGEDLFAKATAAEHNRLLQDALGTLPEDQQHLLDLSFLQGYSHGEISEMLKMPLGTVKTKIRNGLLALRSQLSYLQGELT